MSPAPLTWLRGTRVLAIQIRSLRALRPLADGLCGAVNEPHYFCDLCAESCGDLCVVPTRPAMHETLSRLEGCQARGIADVGVVVVS